MARFFTRVYLYNSNNEDNAYRGTDYSAHVLNGSNFYDNLDDTLDTAEITLVGLSFRDEFQPKTKFIIEYWKEYKDTNGEQQFALWKSLHMCVSADIVSQPIMSDNNYFDHKITFIEASVVTQGRPVDNISISYKLKDITLDIDEGFNTDASAVLVRKNAEYSTTDEYGYSSGLLSEQCRLGHRFEWIMPNWYTVTYDDGSTSFPSWTKWQELKQTQLLEVGETQRLIELPLPMLQCQHVRASTQIFIENGYCSYVVTVNKRDRISGQELGVDQSFTVNPASNFSQESRWIADDIVIPTLSTISGKGWIASSVIPLSVTDATGSTTKLYNKISKLAEWEVFDATKRLLQIQAEPNIVYEISLSLKTFPDTNPSDSLYQSLVAFEITNTNPIDEYPAYYSYGEIKPFTNPFSYSVRTDNMAPAVTTSFQCVQETGETIYLQQPTQKPSAYDLFQKAQLTTQTVEKQDGIYVGNTPSTFYVSDDDKTVLKQTPTIESSYTQKNLWEVFMEVGKYIHARPIVRFGEDDRFIVNWKRYGLTDQKEDNGNKVSVYNSRFVQEYVSAVSSYVSNMVQIGGEITEMLAPKSQSEDYLVYNDVAELITEKSILEIISMTAYREVNGVVQSASLTGGVGALNPNGHIFSKDIYQLLPIDPAINTNKSTAIYYELGDNRIQGFTYQLPTEQPGDPESDFAIKKILGLIFEISPSDWTNIYVNDYWFEIVYRTKDELRSNQSRPDIRKYLLSSKYDSVPLHTQFNNQQDVLVDSQKFGNNVYGKLIRTGNTVYTLTEWIDDEKDLKQSGELYDIYGNLYYVAKVKNTVYSGNIISVVEFSKDFNRLSQIIGIPSEPRFYEIAEKSIVRREVCIDNYLMLGTQKIGSTDDYPVATENNINYIPVNGIEYLGNILLGTQQDVAYPKYAVTTFKVDADAPIVANNQNFNVTICKPLCTYSIATTLTMTWDMPDNFSAGDQLVEVQVPDQTSPSAYRSLSPVKYGDVFNRADLFDFSIVSDAELTQEEIRQLPLNSIDLSQANVLFASASPTDMTNLSHGIVLLKDNREALSFNYNIQMITDSDRFVISPRVWETGKPQLKLAFLKNEVNKFSDGFFPEDDILLISDVTTQIVSSTLFINVREVVVSVDPVIQNTSKALALVYGERSDGKREFAIARNIYQAFGDFADDWKIYCPDLSKSVQKQ